MDGWEDTALGGQIKSYAFPKRGSVFQCGPVNTSLPIPESKTLLKVRYDHYRLADGADLYVTEFGRPVVGHLLPESWFEQGWFRKSREKLQGTSRVYRVRTKPVDGVSKDLVVKWCRVGEDVPMDTFTLNKFIEAEFNSPYEEFSLLMEMRARARPGAILTHKPLAIYVPAKRLELWQTGRSRSKMAQKRAKFRDVELDIFRQYILIYEWIKGVSCTDPSVTEAMGLETEEEARQFQREMLHRSIGDMWQAGFRVLDVKPEHVIVRPQENDGGLLEGRDGLPAYALIDFELLARTPDYEETVKQMRRQIYLERQRDRFLPPVSSVTFPEHLHPVTILGVDYVHGDSDSTHGKLWVVGHDPDLFDYFQPERWRRTPRESLSDTAQVYYTRTKDGIHLVWKVAHVGDPVDAAETSEAHAAHGYNSPFEEFAYALELAAAGVAATYPRAIYMLGHMSTLPVSSLDPRRYESHRQWVMPGGEPVLQPERNYILIWGYWNGLDEVLASEDGKQRYCQGLNADQALARDVITEAQHGELMEKTLRLLASAGFESTFMRGTHFMVTLSPEGELLLDPDGTPTVRMCNFEFLRKLGEPAAVART